MAPLQQDNLVYSFWNGFINENMYDHFKVSICLLGEQPVRCPPVAHSPDDHKGGAGLALKADPCTRASKLPLQDSTGKKLKSQPGPGLKPRPWPWQLESHTKMDACPYHKFQAFTEQLIKYWGNTAKCLGMTTEKICFFLAYSYSSALSHLVQWGCISYNLKITENKS